jgi:hypothetical protein
MAFQLKRPDDMPLKGKIIRERKGVYVCMITFVQSRRHYHDEIVYARNTKEVKAHLARLYPTLTFGTKRSKKNAVVIR